MDEDCGYDVSFVSDVSDHLKCMVCHMVLRHPIQIMSCGHRFCNPCFERIKGYSQYLNTQLLCPVDRDVVDLNKVFQDNGVARMIGDLQTKCGNFEQGCIWIGDLRDLEKHEGKCDHRVLQGLNHVSLQPGTEDTIKELMERVQHCEDSIMNREKDFAHLNFIFDEMKNNSLQREDEIDILKESNLGLHKEMESSRELTEELITGFAAEIEILKNKNRRLEAKVDYLTTELFERKTILKDTSKESVSFENLLQSSDNCMTTEKLSACGNIEHVNAEITEVRQISSSESTCAVERDDVAKEETEILFFGSQIVGINSDINNKLSSYDKEVQSSTSRGNQMQFNDVERLVCVNAEIAEVDQISSSEDMFVVERGDIVEKGMCSIDRGNVMEKDICADARGDAMEKDMCAIEGGDVVEKDMCAVDRGNIVDNDMCAVARDYVMEKDNMLAIKVGDVVEKDVYAVERGDVVEKEMCAVEGGDVVEKDTLVVERVDVVEKDVHVVEREDAVEKDMHAVEKGDVVEKDIHAVEKGDVVEKDTYVVERGDVEEKDMHAVERDEVVEKDMCVVERRDVVEKDTHVVERRDVVEKDTHVVEREDVVEKDICVVERGDVVEKDMHVVEKGDLVDQDVERGDVAEEETENVSIEDQIVDIHSDLSNNLPSYDKEIEALTYQCNQAQNDIKHLSKHIRNIENILFLYDRYVKKDVKLKWVLQNYQYHFDVGESVSSPIFYTMVKGYCFKMFIKWNGYMKESVGLYLRLCRDSSNINKLQPFDNEYTLEILDKKGSSRTFKVSALQIDMNRDDCFTIHANEIEARYGFGDDEMVTMPSVKKYIVDDAMCVSCTIHI